MAVGVLVGPASAQAAAATNHFAATDRAHWAFQKVVRPATPAVQHANRVRNPIDSFILAASESKKLQISPPADKITWLRRASLDLIGLPPAPQEVDAFLADTSPKAFASVVDRLLGSPHYGERWARHWLDLARYAESEGFKADETRPNAWRYRDYVITSLNNDKPYDRFLREQIAGDELWPDDAEARVATGFNRHYPDESNARILTQRRQDILNDITDTVGGVFIGMTYACARCHDHKYEPILQADYYRLQAFFANMAAKDDVVLASAGDEQTYRARLAVWEEKTRDLRAQMKAIEEPHRQALERDYSEKYPPDIQGILHKPATDRSPFEKQMAWKARQYLDPGSREYVGSISAVKGTLKGDEKKRWEKLKAELDEFSYLHPDELPMGSGMIDLGRDSPQAYLLAKGVYDKPREEVAPGFLTILDPAPAKIVPPEGLESSGRRTALANILADPANPLTARVIVNRLWHYHFGRGIVGTPSDFGLKGERPTHPQLLDWLASELIASGWSLKHIHRLIMNSSTYQQASDDHESNAKVDLDNKLWWRFGRQRLEGEVIRDAMLSVAGELNLKMGGPSIFPELPPGMVSRGGWKLEEDPKERNRRSVYVFVRRNTRYPMFETFDMPDTHESCPRRNVTTGPLQALTMLNSRLSLEWAQSFAGRVLEMAGATRDAQIETAFRLAYSRRPDPTEKETVLKFFDRHREIVRDRRYDDQPLALPVKFAEGIDPVDGATLVDFCHMLMNANEFVYRN